MGNRFFRLSMLGKHSILRQSCRNGGKAVRLSPAQKDGKVGVLSFFYSILFNTA